MRSRDKVTTAGYRPPGGPTTVCLSWWALLRLALGRRVEATGVVMERLRRPRRP